MLSSPDRVIEIQRQAADFSDDDAAVKTRTLRVEASLARIEAELKGVADLPFWFRRIRRANKCGKNCTNNQWSWRGDTEDLYMKILGEHLGAGFKVEKKFGFEDLVTNAYYKLYVTISW